MARRSGQNGYVEQKGNAYYVRFWMDVPGQERRAHKSVRLCPVSGPGKMTKPERERKAREVIAASGADTQEYFNKVEAINLGVTFGKQAKWWLDHVQKRKRRPVKPKTAACWKDCLRKWLNPHLGACRFRRSIILPSKSWSRRWRRRASRPSRFTITYRWSRWW